MSVGQAAGSAAMMRMSLPAALSARKGNARPAKFDPPPTHPTMTSGSAPAIASCSFASWPTIVWCSSTWFSTLPSAYLVSSRVAASSTASLIAMPRLPVLSGVASRMPRPAAVSGDGLGTTSPPQVRIIERR